MGSAIDAVIRLFRARADESLLGKFHDQFGSDRCPICSYHRYGLQNGYVRGDPPEHEGCPERGSD